MQTLACRKSCGDGQQTQPAVWGQPSNTIPQVLAGREVRACSETLATIWRSLVHQNDSRAADPSRAAIFDLCVTGVRAEAVPTCIPFSTGRQGPKALRTHCRHFLSLLAQYVIQAVSHKEVVVGSPGGCSCSPAGAPAPPKSVALHAVQEPFGRLFSAGNSIAHLQVLRLANCKLQGPDDTSGDWAGPLQEQRLQSLGAASGSPMCEGGIMCQHM